MTFKKIQICLFILFMAASFILLNMVIDLSAEKKENQASIQILTREVANMEKTIANLEKDKMEMALLRFKDRIFSLRYGDFSNISKIVFDKSIKYGFSPYLTMAVIQVESNFNPYAVSTAGAYGLMQVNYSVWKNELNIDFNRIFDMEYNIELGLTVLKHYYEKTDGDLLKALFHYNNGYKYNNTDYNTKIISTAFYAKRDKASDTDTQTDNDLSI